MRQRISWPVEVVPDALQAQIPLIRRVLDLVDDNRQVRVIYTARGMKNLEVL